MLFKEIFVAWSDSNQKIQNVSTSFPLPCEVNLQKMQFKVWTETIDGWKIDESMTACPQQKALHYMWDKNVINVMPMSGEETSPSNMCTL